MSHPLNWKNIYSSHIDRIAYDPVAQELHVTWDTGKHSIYGNVPPAKASAVMNSASVGTALHTKIKRQLNHPHRYGP
jgi:KTSC domain-containing protein